MSLELTMQKMNITKKDAAEIEIKNITLLKEKLIKIGYNSSEVDYMISKTCGTSKIHELDMDKLIKLQDELHEQLKMAQKCLDII